MSLLYGLMGVDYPTTDPGYGVGQAMSGGWTNGFDQSFDIPRYGAGRSVRPDSLGSSDSNPYAGWGFGAGLAIQGVGDYFTSTANAKAAVKMTKQGFKNAKFLDAEAQRRKLEDQRFTEEAIGNYRDQSSPGLMRLAPEYTDPATIKPVDPYAR